MTPLNETHSIDLRSWVASANDGATDFPLQNLPFGIFRRRGSNESFRGGVAIGDQILDLASAVHRGVFNGLAQGAAVSASRERLNDFMAMGTSAWSALRLALSRAMMDTMRAFVHTGNPNNATVNQNWTPWPSRLMFDADQKAVRLSVQ